jgi:hypothetical protein
MEPTTITARESAEFMTAHTLGISPPSTRSTEPVIYEARVLARKATASAYSTGHDDVGGHAVAGDFARQCLGPAEQA